MHFFDSINLSISATSSAVKNGLINQVNRSQPTPEISNDQTNDAQNEEEKGFIGDSGKLELISEGWTALALACRAGQYEIAKYLLDRGCNPNTLAGVGKENYKSNYV